MEQEITALINDDSLLQYMNDNMDAIIEDDFRLVNSDVPVSMKPASVDFTSCAPQEQSFDPRPIIQFVMESHQDKFAKGMKMMNSRADRVRRRAMAKGIFQMIGKIMQEYADKL